MLRYLMWISAFLALPIVAQAQSLTDGVAITDPALVSHLQGTRFSAGSLLFPGRVGSKDFKNDNLFKGPMTSVDVQFKKDISTLPQQSLDQVAKDFFKDPDSEGHRFSAKLLDDPNSGFVLTGVVNRMDRAYRVVDGSPKLPTCGEIRFLYRFTYDVNVAGRKVASRLPFTMSIVLNARNRDTQLTCAEIATRWVKLRTFSDTAALTNYLDGPDGPLAYIDPDQVDRVEMNLQLFRVPAGVKTDFGGDAEYLLRVFRRDHPGAPFVPTRLENQIDRDDLLAHPRRLAAFKKWLFSRAAMMDLDRGILDIPFAFLADHAISVSPGGAARSENQPFYGLFSEGEIQSAREAINASGPALVTIKSNEGFKRRINDMGCNGCHQTRAIAGFHFTGADPETEPAANAVHVPGSAHFLGDMPRRSAIIASFAAGKRPDFFRGFSARPDEKYRSALIGTQILDGWGSICYLGNDPSFASWTCAGDMQCKTLDAFSRSAGIGVCVTKIKAAIGDPMEFGDVSYTAYGDDSFRRISPPGPSTPDNYKVPDPPGDRNDYVVSHQGYRKADLTGGFPAGMLRIDGCTDLPGEAICGKVAKSGFNDCVASGKPFTDCLTHTAPAGLRGCNLAKPCREDYICTAPYKDLGDTHGLGTCIPPYFMFQFRVDGHPSSFTTEEIYSDPSQ
jgi:hypothetical protein